MKIQHKIFKNKLWGLEDTKSWLFNQNQELEERRNYTKQFLHYIYTKKQILWKKIYKSKAFNFSFSEKEEP